MGPRSQLHCVLGLRGEVGEEVDSSMSLARLELLQ